MPPVQMIEINGELVHYNVVVDEKHSTITVSLVDYPQFTSSTYFYKSYKPAIIEKLVKELYALAKEKHDRDK